VTAMPKFKSIHTPEYNFLGPKITDEGFEFHAAHRWEGHRNFDYITTTLSDLDAAKLAAWIIKRLEARPNRPR